MKIMSVLAGALSPGRFADLLARTVGWSPVGRSIALQGAEGPDSCHFAGMSGTVVSVSDGVMMVEAARENPESRGPPVRLRLTPRHKGWTPFSLMLVRIAVVAEIVNEGSGPERVAIVVAGLNRQRDRSDRRT
jgi:hypothetical protein